MEIFNKKKFLSLCKAQYCGKEVICFKNINSTNDHAIKLEDKALKLNNCSNFFNKLNGAIIISETQKSGRGRSYKKWFSPPGGLWFTLILISRINPYDVKKINLIMAISILESLKNIFGIDLKVKWPNDLYYNQKKLCGVLSELNSYDEVSFLNVGAGLNANISFNNSPDSENSLAGNAISLKEILKQETGREEILADIIKNFEINYEGYMQSCDLKSIFLKIENSILI